MASVANVFALLDDEGTVDAGALAAKLPVASKEAAPKPAADTKQAAARPASATSNRGGRAAEAPKARGGRTRPASAGTGGDDATFDAEGAPAARGAARSNRNGRGGRGRGDGRKREFDRHDASGRGHETEKRHGQGRGNWGAEGEEANEDLNKLQITDDAADGEDAPAREEEEKQLSLEEYEALMAEKRAALNVVRDTSATVDKKQFDGMKAFTKVEDDAGISLNKNAKAAKAAKEKERKERDILTDVGFRVANAETNRPARTGRGGRGGNNRSRGGGRSDRGGRGGRGPSIRIDDASAFPSLG